MIYESLHILETVMDQHFGAASPKDVLVVFGFDFVLDPDFGAPSELAVSVLADVTDLQGVLSASAESFETSVEDPTALSACLASVLNVTLELNVSLVDADHATRMYETLAAISDPGMPVDSTAFRAAVEEFYAAKVRLVCVNEALVNILKDGVVTPDEQVNFGRLIAEFKDIQADLADSTSKIQSILARVLDTRSA